jgi:hypothetical protein
MNHCRKKCVKIQAKKGCIKKMRLKSTQRLGSGRKGGEASIIRCLPFPCARFLKTFFAGFIAQQKCFLTVAHYQTTHCLRRKSGDSVNVAKTGWDGGGGGGCTGGHRAVEMKYSRRGKRSSTCLPPTFAPTASKRQVGFAQNSSTEATPIQLGFAPIVYPPGQYK